MHHPRSTFHKFPHSAGLQALRTARGRGKISLGEFIKACYVLSAFVALVTPLDSIEGAASSLAASFALRLEAVEKHK
jgi:hypothetical protein